MAWCSNLYTPLPWSILTLGKWDWTCAGPYWALVGSICALVGCAGICWAIQGSTVLKPRHVHVKLLAVYTNSCKTIARVHKLM